MIRLPKMKNRIHLTIGEVEFVMAPLSLSQKYEITQATNIVNGEMVQNLFKSQCLYLKYGLKDIVGIEDYDGNKYELDFQDDILTDDCVSELLMLPIFEKMISAAFQFLNSIPDELKDFSTGKKLKGATLEVKSPK